jgi:hypothetical protein
MRTHALRVSFQYVCPHCQGVVGVNPTGEEWMNNFWTDVLNFEFGTRVECLYETECAYCGEHVTVELQ